jgi:hypothetical protein
MYYEKDGHTVLELDKIDEVEVLSAQNVSLPR